MKNLIPAAVLALAVLTFPAPAHAEDSPAPDCDTVIINDALLLQNRVLRSNVSAYGLQIEILTTENTALTHRVASQEKALDRKTATIKRLRAKIRRLQTAG